MDKREFNKLTMMKTWLAFMDNNREKWQGNAPIEAAYAQVKNLVAQINLNMKTKGSNNKGETEQKLSLQDAVIESGFELVSLVYAYADEKTNLPLIRKVDYPISDLRNLRDDELSAKFLELFDLIDEYKTELEAYGISQRKIDGLKNLIEQYEEQLPKKRNKLGDKKVATKKAKDAVSTAYNIIKKRVGKLMMNYKTSEPDFYNAYQTASKVVDLGRRYEQPAETEEQQADVVK